jgi:diguanylate cyclase (GGDEF)-like protein
MLWQWPVLFALLLVGAAFAVRARMQKQRVLAQRNSLLNWFSSLHTFRRNVDEGSDTAEIVEAVLAGTLRIYGDGDGLVLLGSEAAGSLSQVCARGLSARVVEVVSAEPMRAYLTSAFENWGSLLVVPDLHKPGMPEEWERVPLLRQFIATMREEGLKSLLIVGLAARGRSYGVLVTGRRRAKAFASEELQLAVAIGNQLSVALDNRWLVREWERRDAELQTLDQVGRTMRGTFDLYAQMAALRHSMKDLFEGCDFALAMQESPERPLEVVAPFERSSAEGLKAPRKASSLESEVALSNTPCLIGESRDWAKYPPWDAGGPSGIRTWCGVPLHFSDGSCGVLEVASFERGGAITPERFELIRVLAKEAEGAIENARAFREEQRRADRLALLNEIGRKATSVLDPRELLANVCAQIRTALGYDLAVAEIYDGAADELVREAASGWGKDLVGSRTASGRSISSQALERREPVVTNWTEGAPADLFRATGVRCSLSLPLEYQGVLLGLLTLADRRPQAFRTAEVLTLKTLADQVAIALHHAREFQSVLGEAITDGLTGLKTQRYFLEALGIELRRSQRSGRPFAVIMMDLGQFKPVNDQHGQAQGGRVLIRVAHLMKNQIRQSSVAARYGGDEFAILLPDTTVEQARHVAERLCASIEKEPLLAEHQGAASFGIAAFPEHGFTQEQVLQVAGLGMYLAKHQKGNRVAVATPEPDSGQAQTWCTVPPKH